MAQPDPSLRDAARSLQLLRSTASSGHRAARSLLPRSGTASSGQCARRCLGGLRLRAFRDFHEINYYYLWGGRARRPPHK
ncbi:MAG: hypothetical protein ACYTXA_21110 [Nostoc sp.]